jgi:predicted nucleotidyltransferase
MELTKKIVRVGNSAGVILPREWYGGEARIELIEKPIDIKKDLFEILSPYLEEIIGIYLVGSYARREQTSESDVDVLVITNNLKKRIEKEKYEITLISKDSVEKQLNNNILPLLPMIKEAKPLMNANLIENYKNTKITKKNLKFHIETTKSAMEIIKENLKLAKEMKIKEGDGSAYSLILRLRGIYIVDCLKSNKKWSKKEFLRLIKKISGSLKVYEGYLRIKANKKAKNELLIEEVQRLYDYIIKGIKQQEIWIKNKKIEE